MEQGQFIAENGACRGYPTEWWFPLKTTGKRDELIRLRKNTEQAKIICVSCECRTECLDYSLRWEPWGIWGGEDEQSRAELRRKLKITITG